MQLCYLIVWIRGTSLNRGRLGVATGNGKTWLGLSAAVQGQKAPSDCDWEVIHDRRGFVGETRSTRRSFQLGCQNLLV